MQAVTPGSAGGPSARVRRLWHAYAWLIIPLLLALVVGLGAPWLLSRTGASWTPAGPGAAGPRPPAPAGAPHTTAGAASSPAVSVRASLGPATRTGASRPPRQPAATAAARAPVSSGSAGTAGHPPAPTATPVRTPTLLGPRDGALAWMLAGYCWQRLNAFGVRLRTGSKDPAANNWECTRRDGDPLIDMGDFCRWAYPGTGGTVFATYSDPHNAYTWRCYRR